jgi:hypothetical protein
MDTLSCAVASALALGFPLVVVAQQTPVDPADAKAPAPGLFYQSAFADYKPYQDIKPGDWKALVNALRETGKAQDMTTPAREAMPSSPTTRPESGTAHHEGHGGKR